MDIIKKGSKVRVMLKIGGEGEWKGKVILIGKFLVGVGEGEELESFVEEEMNF